MALRQSVVLIAFSFFYLQATAAPAADEIISLPGYSGSLPSKQYSGYLSIKGGTNLHYYLVTSESTSSRTPTVIWLNGGPGCSSLDGLLKF